MILFENGTERSGPEKDRMDGIMLRLKNHGICIERYNALYDTARYPAVQKLVQEHGEKTFPIVFVNGFVMITGRYPTNEEIRQILNVPSRLIEPKQEGCCCISGCGCPEGQRT